MKTRSPARPPVDRKTFLFALGIGLLGLSYLVYPGYAVLPFLNLSRQGIATGAFALWVTSWALFLAGTAFAGKEGVEWLRRRVPLRRRRELVRRESRAVQGGRLGPSGRRDGSVGKGPTRG